MELLETILNRRTTNVRFQEKPLSDAHIRTLLEAASYAPSHMNSQPWRFAIIRDHKRRQSMARIARDSMRMVMERGAFWKRYLSYFRFSKEETDKKGDGIHIDKLPKLIRPLAQYIFSEKGAEWMIKLRIPSILALDSQKLIGTSPLILAVVLTKAEFRRQELSGMYSTLALGMAIENIWLTATSLGIGIQFISLPMEAGGEMWQKCIDLVEVPEDYELIALFRLGYIDPGAKRPTIDWSSTQRKHVSSYCFEETFGTPWQPHEQSLFPVPQQHNTDEPTGHIQTPVTS